jgi:hypothetical protein
LIFFEIELRDTDKLCSKSAVFSKIHGNADKISERFFKPVFFFLCLAAGLWIESVFPDTVMQMPSMLRTILGLVAAPVGYSGVAMVHGPSDYRTGSVSPDSVSGDQARERYLAGKFGKEYTDYAARVGRWI